jgi:hypothetical protein
VSRRRQGPTLVGAEDGCQISTDPMVVGGAVYFTGRDQVVMSPGTWADIRQQPRLTAAWRQALRERSAEDSDEMKAVIVDAGRFGRERRDELARLRRLGADVGLVEATEQGLHHLIGQMAAMPDPSPVQVGGFARRYGELSAEVEQVRAALCRVEGMLEFARVGVVEHLDPTRVAS